VVERPWVLAPQASCWSSTGQRFFSFPFAGTVWF
jgi:hypothetical protein